MSDGDPSVGGSSGAGSSSSTTGVPDPGDEGDSTTRGDSGSDAAMVEDSGATGASSSGGDPLPQGEPQVCTVGTCVTRCSGTQIYTTEGGSVCECDSPGTWSERLECPMLPSPCQTTECVVQAIRYGVVGRYGLGNVFDDGELDLEVFGPGRVRASLFGQTYYCCDRFVDAYRSYFHPQQVPPADDDAFWSECLASGASTASGDCMDPDVLFGPGRCEPPLAECPVVEPPDPDAPCEISCPMANDGVCDGPSGTGLCSAECDAADCAPR